MSLVMSSDGPSPPSIPQRWPVRFVALYQRGSSILPSSSLAIGLLLLLALFLAVLAGIFFAEGNAIVGWVLMIVVVVLAYGLWRNSKRQCV